MFRLSSASRSVQVSDQVLRELKLQHVAALRVAGLQMAVLQVLRLL